MENMFKMAIKAIEDKKGTDITTIEFKEQGSIADAFIIATGNNDRQTKAIAENVELELGKAGETVLRHEGYQLGKWIVLDYGFLMVHIFTPQEREYYDIERLWQESKKLLTPDSNHV